MLRGKRRDDPLTTHANMYSVSTQAPHANSHRQCFKPLQLLSRRDRNNQLHNSCNMLLLSHGFVTKEVIQMTTEQTYRIVAWIDGVLYAVKPIVHVRHVKGN